MKKPRSSAILSNSSSINRRLTHLSIWTKRYSRKHLQRLRTDCGYPEGRRYQRNSKRSEECRGTTTTRREPAATKSWDLDLYRPTCLFGQSREVKRPTRCFGYIPVEAADADEAFAILQSRSDIALLFADIQMPGSMDGLQLAQTEAGLKSHYGNAECHQQDDHGRHDDVQIKMDHAEPTARLLVR